MEYLLKYKWRDYWHLGTKWRRQNYSFLYDRWPCQLTLEKFILAEKEINQKSISERTSLGLTYLPQESSIFKGLTVEASIFSALEQKKDLNSGERLKELQYLLKEFELHGLSNTLGIKFQVVREEELK